MYAEQFAIVQLRTVQVAAENISVSVLTDCAVLRLVSYALQKYPYLLIYLTKPNFVDCDQH